MKKISAFLIALLLITLCACSGQDTPTQTPDTDPNATPDDAQIQFEIQYDYSLNAGEPVEVYNMTFEEMVTVTVDPDSTRDGPIEQRSSIFFDDCTFNGGLTIVGDYHAMILFGAGCSFPEGSVITCQEATPGISRETTLSDNCVKVTVACEGANVETESAIGLLSEGPDVTLNGTVYSKSQLAPDAAFLGIYATYQDQALTYTKLAIGEDESVEFLE